MSHVTGTRAEEDPFVGRVLHGRYRVLRRIGEGSMGFVYEVEHTAMGRRFALKMLRPESATRPDAVKRFHREARAAAAVGHDGIVSVTDMGLSEEGVPFLVMELLEGNTVAAELRRTGPLTIARALTITLACAEAVSAAHRAKVIHRDLKPDNIFIARAPGRPLQVKILDFGVSRIREAMSLADSFTQAGSLLGTPYYMSPEQFEGRPDLDERADVYGLGVVLYQLLTGEVPFKAANLAMLMMEVCKGPPPSPRKLAAGTPADLDAIVRQAMATKREERIPSMDALAASLRPILARYSDEDVGTAETVAADARATDADTTESAASLSSTDVSNTPAGRPEPGGDGAVSPVPAWLDEPTEHDPGVVARAIEQHAQAVRATPPPSAPPSPPAADPLATATLPDAAAPVTLAGIGASDPRLPPGETALPATAADSPPVSHAPPGGSDGWREPTEHLSRDALQGAPAAKPRRGLPWTVWVGAALIGIALAGLVALILGR